MSLNFKIKISGEIVCDECGKKQRFEGLQAETNHRVFIDLANVKPPVTGWILSEESGQHNLTAICPECRKL